MPSCLHLVRAGVVAISLSVVGCGSNSGPGTGSDFNTVSTVDPVWNRCEPALREGWPSYVLGLAYPAEPGGLSEFLGVEEAGTVCTASGPQGQLLWLVLTDGGPPRAFVEDADGSPIPSSPD
jgi:hypothetical protein